MKIGYPDQNLTINCSANTHFNIDSYSLDIFNNNVNQNLSSLLKILQFNIYNNIRFFRIHAELIPYGYHPICKVDWPRQFKKQLREIGKYINLNKIRIVMHPEQFVVLNSPNIDVVRRSIAELEYQSSLLDYMGLEVNAKIQIPVGGDFGEKLKSRDCFIDRYKALNPKIRNRVVIENDSWVYKLSDCLTIHKETGTPVALDMFAQLHLNNGESIEDALSRITSTWKRKDGIPIVSFSHQMPGAIKGKHANHIEKKLFGAFIEKSKKYDFDIMIDYNDYEKSALDAIPIAKNHPKFIS